MGKCDQCIAGLTLTLRTYDSIPTDGSGRILITDIVVDNVGTTDEDADALICQSDVASVDIPPIYANWYLNSTQLSTEEDGRIQSSDLRGWVRNRGEDASGNEIVRLKRHSTLTAEEGVFTCHVIGDSNTPVSVGIFYPSESITLDSNLVHDTTFVTTLPQACMQYFLYVEID